MSYPQHPAQRPPPLRQYNNPAPPSVASPGGYSQDGSHGGYSDSGMSSYQHTDPGYDDTAYSYQSSSSSSQPYAAAQSQPRSMRPPGPPGPPGPGYGRPPGPGYDDRRGYPPNGSGRPPPQSRSRTRMLIQKETAKRLLIHFKLVHAHPQAVPSTIHFPLFLIETQEIRGRPETRATRETLEAKETRGIGVVRHRGV